MAYRIRGTNVETVWDITQILDWASTHPGMAIGVETPNPKFVVRRDGWADIECDTAEEAAELVRALIKQAQTSTQAEPAP